MTDTPDAFLWVQLGGLALALGFLFFAFRARAKKYLIDNLPTSKVEGVFIGLVELEGTAETESPFTSHLAELPCVLYHWKVEENWRRVETETYTDKDGKSRSRTRTRSGWTTVASGGEERPFYLKDETGVIRIDPARATQHTERLFYQECGRTHPLYYGKGPAMGIANSTHRRRFNEQAIPLHHPVYVVGKARERSDIVAPEIVHDPDAPLFIVSTKPQKAVSRGYALQYWGLGFLAAVAVYGANLYLWHEDPDPFLKALQTAWPWLIGVGIAGGFGWVWMIYNSLIDLRQRVRRGWSLIDIELKRRADLIPKIVKVVEGYRSHEKEVQETVAQLRTQAAATEPGTLGPDPQGCLGAVRALAESYPELKADGPFLELQKTLSQTEQRIALARSYFNDITTNFNTRLEVFPESLVAKLGRFEGHPLVAAEDFERAVVKVDLAP